MNYRELSSGTNKPFAEQETEVRNNGEVLTIPTFLTLQQVADRTVFSLSALKRMKKEGVLPSVNVGSKCFVNYPAFLQMLEEKSRSGNFQIVDRVNT